MFISSSVRTRVYLCEYSRMNKDQLCFRMFTSKPFPACVSSNKRFWRNLVCLVFIFIFFKTKMWLVFFFLFLNRVFKKPSKKTKARGSRRPSCCSWWWWCLYFWMKRQTVYLTTWLIIRCICVCIRARVF